MKKSYPVHFLAFALYLILALGVIPISSATVSATVIHSKVGDRSEGVEGQIRLSNIGKKQQFVRSEADSWDEDISSPKSVTFSPNGKHFYVNSLEGCKTVVYDAATLKKIAVYEHDYDPVKQPELFAPLSGYYDFTHYPDGATKPFKGKPVESTWSHDGRYLWIPFYRRTFDLNAQDPSAIAVIDTKENKVVRVFETGPLPKMVRTSHDGKTLAITHWGNNTVGFLDITGNDPSKWHHLPPVTIARKLELNYPLNRAVNRDTNSGYLLRGTVFTPDDRYLLVSGMAGPLQVIDMATRTHIGSFSDLHSIRHLTISGDHLYGSQNTASTILKVHRPSLIAAIDKAKAEGNTNMQLGDKVTKVSVGNGARTLSISPDGKYAFVACNLGNAVYVVDTDVMEVVDNIRCDSYPVGLALSPDGHRMVVTSQGRSGNGGGNAVNIFEIDRFDNYDYVDELNKAPEPRQDVESETQHTGNSDEGSILRPVAMIVLGLVFIGLCAMVINRRRRKK